MSAKEFAGQMKQAVAQLKTQGGMAVPCDSLISYLEKVESSSSEEPNAMEIEKYKAELQNWHAGNLEMFKSVITAGQGAIKTTFLLNGGAAVAMLAFVGHLATQDNKLPHVPEFAASLAIFALGVLAIAVTSGLTYLSQWFYGGNIGCAKRVGFFLNIACIVCGISSYGFFVWGLLKAYSAFLTFH